MTIPRIDPLPHRARACATALLLALVAGSPARAASADPLQSDECRRAVAALQSEEDAAVTPSSAKGAATRFAPAAPGRSLQDARRTAARRCLASRVDVEPARSRLAQAPIIVEPIGPIAPARPAQAALPSSLHPLQAPLPPRRPDAVVSCDPGGCWASDGSRLNRVGPVLWGPRGACTVQGASLQCP